MSSLGEMLFMLKIKRRLALGDEIGILVSQELEVFPIDLHLFEELLNTELSLDRSHLTRSEFELTRRGFS